VSAIQKDFPSRDDMLDAAFQLACERTATRMAAAGPDGPPRAHLRRPHPVLTELDTRIHRHLTAWLREPGVDDRPDAVARAVLALADGLALTLLHQPDTADRCLRALDTVLAALVPD
jgi:AcrR family transcriptional regulator